MSQSYSNNRGRLSIVSCESGKRFAQRVDESLVEIIKIVDGRAASSIRGSEEMHFPNGEMKSVIKENVRGDDVYVIQCCEDPLSDRSINDNFMALLTALHAVHNSDADSITAVIPQFPYARQERKKEREPITARLVAGALEDASANRVITLDIHAEAIVGFFRQAILEDLHASRDIIDFFKKAIPVDEESGKELVIVAPDVGGANMARYYSNKFNCALALVDKTRDYSQASLVTEMRLVGDVRDKIVILPDDIIATGGTLVNACRILRDHGAAKIFVACSLPLFNGDAMQKLDRAYSEGLFEMVVGTDAVWHGEEFKRNHPWYREVSVAGLFAKVIFNINRRRSVSELLR